jgi:hypothetical protein
MGYRVVALDHLGFGRSDKPCDRVPVAPGDVAPDRADPRAAASVTVMDSTTHTSFLPHDDPDASLTFYRDRPVVPVVLLLLRAGPG